LEEDGDSDTDEEDTDDSASDVTVVSLPERDV